MTKNNSPKSFTSYAQNFEDVMLWRALKHVPAGVYVDVGAQHPVVDSVSKAFYEQGWRGIHVEPVPHYAELLRQDRPDELVLQLALADRAGILELHVVAGTGLSTGVKAYAQSLEETHGFAHQTIPTPMLPMSTALESLAGRQVHWLKIDVEGFEDRVLMGLSRPVPALSFEFTTIGRDVAQSCLDRLAALGPYGFDVALGEVQRLTFGRWVSPDEMAAHLAALPHEANSGDVYAVLDP